MLRRFFPTCAARLAAGAFLTAAVFLTATPVIAEVLAPGESVEDQITADQAHLYDVTSLAGPPWRLDVEQLGIDVAITLRGIDGSELGELRSLLGRFDAASYLLNLPIARLDVRPLPGTVATGAYRLELKPAPAPPPGDPESLAFRRHRGLARLTEVGLLASDATNKDLIRAAELSKDAAEDLAAAGDPAGELRARLQAADLLRRANESSDSHALYLEASRLAAAQDDAGREGRALEGLGQTARRLGKNDLATESLEHAAEIWRRLGWGPELGSTLGNLGLFAHMRGDFADALRDYKAALDEQKRAGQALEVGSLLLNLGGVYSQLGDADAALDADHEALAIFRRLGDMRSEMNALNNLAALHRQMGEPGEALRLYGEVRTLAGRLGDGRAEGRALNNRGYAYFSLGDVERAADDYTRAFELRRAANDLRGESYTLTNLGNVELHRGDLPAARRHLDQALDLAEKTDGRNLVSILAHRVRLFAALGDHGIALAAFERAVTRLTERPDAMAEAELYYHHGETLIDRNPAAARLALERALELWRQHGYEPGVALALVALGRAERATGKTIAARDQFLEAIETIEALRVGVEAPDLRAAFLASRRDAYEQLIEVLMELHADAPSAGHQLAALEISERSRARGLLDLVAETEAKTNDKLDTAFPELTERRRALLRRLSLLSRTRQLAAAGRRRGVSVPQINAQITDVRAALDLAEADIHRRTPRRTALHAPTPLKADAMRRLLEPGTLLLHFALGSEKTYLWTVSVDEIRGHVLPPSAEVETLARRAHEALSTLGDGPSARHEALQALSTAVLDPIADELEGIERLVVLPDGALWYVPLAALPAPGDVSGYVMEHFEVARLPSAAVFAALPRAPETQIAQAPTSVAIYADPVFDLRDPRVLERVADGANGLPASAPASPPSMARLASADFDLALAAEGFGRLPASRLEAEAIAALVPSDRRLLALGFDANRDALMVPALEHGGRKIVHLATHGLLDTEHPRLSGIVLSQISPDGRRHGEGILHLGEIYNLDLTADLVVLSGCRTALGREVRGEGLWGLTMGFFHAGARRVMASLWSVGDRSTADLMGHFYRGLVVDGLSPATALRRAQLELLADRRYRDPYHWAPFVLQGDWR